MRKGRFIMSVVIGGMSGPGWCRQPDPTGTSPVTTSARTRTTNRYGIVGNDGTSTMPEAGQRQGCPRRFARTRGLNLIDLKAWAERTAARDPDRQTAEIRIRGALINRFFAPGIGDVVRVA
jgi:hypothetical protein